MDIVERKRLKDAFLEWTRDVPNPDEPMMGLVGTRLYSPREMAGEVERETEFGQSIMEIIEHGAKVEGIDKAVARLTRKTIPRKAP